MLNFIMLSNDVVNLKTNLVKQDICGLALDIDETLILASARKLFNADEVVVFKPASSLF